MRALILSAGFGERLRPLTAKRAKPAIEFLNIPMLGYPYYWLNQLGLSDLVVNTHYLPESVRHAAMHVAAPAVGLHFTHEPTILGSGGGIAFAHPHLHGDEDFVVANADGVVLFEDYDVLERMLDFHRQKKALATLLVCPLEGMGTRLPGVWLDVYGEVSGFGKAPPRVAHSECLHFASYMILSSRIWRYLPEGASNILYDVLDPQILAGERVFGYRVDNMRWYETGTVADYLAASFDVLSEIQKDSRLGQCALRILEKMAPPFEVQTDWSNRKFVADTAEISTRAQLLGPVVLGPRTVVQSHAVLDHAVLLEGSRLESGATCRQQVLILD